MKKSPRPGTSLATLAAGCTLAVAVAAGLAGCHSASDPSQIGQGNTPAPAPAETDQPALSGAGAPTGAGYVDSGSPPTYTGDPGGTTSDFGSGAGMSDQVPALPPGYDMGSSDYEAPPQLRELWNEGG